MVAGGGFQVYAHRCGGALAPENTLAGLSIAARLGCRAVEFDVMLSADGVPLLIHDETLARTAGCAGRVPDMIAADLRQVDVGYMHHSAFSGETIPTLQDALTCCSRLGLAANVEIKPATGHESETGRAVGEVLQGSAHLPAVLLSSFSPDALEHAIRRSPGQARALLAECLSAGVLQTVRDLGCVGVNLGRQSLDRDHVRQARAAGLQVLIYTINDVADAAVLRAWGVAGVFTDRPDLFPGPGTQPPAWAGNQPLA